ncbi:Hypothetical predicted protein, partial [Marmota monax]
MRFKNRFQRFMNHRAPANGRYKPTCYEHAANCYTHAVRPELDPGVGGLNDPNF